MLTPKTVADVFRAHLDDPVGEDDAICPMRFAANALGYPQGENLPRQPWIDDFIEATDWYTGEVLGNLNRWSSVAGKEAMILLNMATGLGHTL
jgi:hypothetical protein